MENTPINEFLQLPGGVDAMGLILKNVISESFQQYLNFCSTNKQNKRLCDKINMDNKFWYEQYKNKIIRRDLPYSDDTNYYNELFEKWNYKTPCDPRTRPPNVTPIQCLHRNVLRGDLANVKYLVEVEKVDLSNSDNILNLAINGDNLEVIKYLISRGITPSFQNLRFAVSQGNLDAFKYLSTFIINIDNNSKQVLIHSAINKGNMEILKLIIDIYNPELTDFHLFETSLKGNFEMFKYFYDKGFNYDPQLLLINAINSENRELIAFIMDKFNITIDQNIINQVNPNKIKFAKSISGDEIITVTYDMLVKAARNSELESLEYLLNNYDQPIDPDILSRFLDALKEPIEFDYELFKRLIMEHDFNLNGQHLSLALELEDPEIFEFLLENMDFNIDAFNYITSSQFATIDLLERLMGEYDITPNSDTFTFVIQSNNKEIIKFIFDLIEEPINFDDAINLANHYLGQEMVEYIETLRQSLP